MISESLPRLPEHNRALMHLYSGEGGAGKNLSPSAVNTWINCRMRFYFRYVCGMPEEEILEKEIDQRRFGNIMHETLRRLYDPLRNSSDAGASIARLASDRDTVRETVIGAAMDEMRWDRETLFSGKGVIIVDVLERYAVELLEYDGRHPDLTLLHLEDDFTSVRTVKTDKGEVIVRLGGRADRVDMTGGVIRVVDYKTGAPKREAVTADGLFDEEKEKRNDAVLQALLYCTMVERNHPGKIVLPAIYWIQQLKSDGFTPYASAQGLGGTDVLRGEWDAFMKAFIQELDMTLQRIFSDSEDFRMTSFRQRCSSCPYRTLCRR